MVKGGYIEKLKKLEKVYEKSRRMNQILKDRQHNQRKNFRKKLQQLENQVRIYKEHSKYLNNFSNEDQLKLLSKTYKKMPAWCDATLIHAYHFKFSCGYSGYTELIPQSFPLPSLRTLSRKLEGWKFESGPSEELFEFIKIKVSQIQKNIDRDCILVLDLLNTGSKL